MHVLESLEEAEKMRQTNPYLYLVACMISGRQGSLIVASKEKLPLYHVYFMVYEANKQPDVAITITSVQLIAE